MLEKNVNMLLCDSLRAFLTLPQFCEILKQSYFFPEQEAIHSNINHSESTNNDHVSTSFFRHGTHLPPRGKI